MQRRNIPRGDSISESRVYPEKIIQETKGLAGQIQRNNPPPTDRLKIEEAVTNYLKNQGYLVTRAAKVIRQSGVEHVFDMLAEADEYLVHNIIAIGFALNGQKNAIGNIIFEFSNKAYDAGINQRILVVDEEIDNKIKALARQKRIKIFDIAQIATFAKAPAL
jgi:hypothetical protein